jgi:hypothetical protein
MAAPLSCWRATSERAASRAQPSINAFIPSAAHNAVPPEISVGTLDAMEAEISLVGIMPKDVGIHFAT